MHYQIKSLQRCFLVRIRQKFLLLFCLVALGMMACKHVNEVDLTTLLYEMADRDNITRFPRNGYKTLQASSYNRESVSPDEPGWFADSDGIGFIRTELVDGNTEWVIMEDEGPGVITKIWAVCFYYDLQDTTGANIKIYLDGQKEAVINTNFFALVKGHDFIKAPFAEESTRAGNLYFPIPYAKSCKITMDKKSFYNIINYRKYPAGTKVKTFSMDEFDKVSNVREEIGKVLVNPPGPKGKEIEKQKILHKDETLKIDLQSGQNAIRQLEIKIHSAKDYAQALRSTILVADFDGENTIWCPVGDFFNNVGKIQPYEMWERSVKEDSMMVCRWVMPYQLSGSVSLVNLFDQSVEVSLKIIQDTYLWEENSMHFYTTWRLDPPRPTFPLFDWNFLTAEGRGVLVGDQWTVLNPAEGWWGEGDEKIYVDDDFERNFPSHFGTGTEDYYGWAGGVVPTPADEFSKPFLGNIIVGDPRSQGYNVCTRTRVLDAIPFNEKLKFDFESSCGTRQSWFYLQYSQATFWYAMPGVSHNREPLPTMAAKKLPALDDLQMLIEKAKNEVFLIEGALEAENMRLSDKSMSVYEDFAEIQVWGEASNASFKNLWFKNKGDVAEFTITEQFEMANVKIATVVGPNCGVFEIYVNDKYILTQDLYSNHPGITSPYIDLGENKPVDNAFKIAFVLKGTNIESTMIDQKTALGVDFFLIENNFLNR